MILNASLDEESIPLERLFDKIELICLETTDNSLIRNYVKYDFLDNKHYILDDSQSILFIFDDKGNYIDRIARIGQGPGEYTLICDFSLNLKKEQIEMLSPYRFIYCYDFNGNFIKKYDLNFLHLPSLQRLKVLDDENYVLWSVPEDKLDGICVISQETGEILNSYWQDIFIINMWSSNVFYSYNNKTYFSLALYNTVYEVTKEKVVAEYEWNFGNKTMNINQHKISTGMYNYQNDSKNLAEKIKNRIIQYEFIRNYQNKQYYYAQLRFEMKYHKHLFFDKNTSETFFFESPLEGIRFNPILYFSDEFMIGILNYKEKDKLRDCPLIDETNKQKLLSYKEEDNPFLIKYYFKTHE
ncbi:hypothetical protein FACS189440_21530 [Bacteroidia bacterium]|nr:hypothetical protein FACS189440_21530 [Bacteroidia bacterium]